MFSDAPAGGPDLVGGSDIRVFGGQQAATPIVLAYSLLVGMLSLQVHPDELEPPSTALLQSGSRGHGERQVQGGLSGDSDREVAIPLPPTVERLRDPTS